MTNLIDPDTLTFTEVCDQLYAGNDARFSAGFVDGHPVDNMYLRIERPGTPEITLLLRPDEVSALMYVLNGTLWSWLVSAAEGGNKKMIVTTEG